MVTRFILCTITKVLVKCFSNFKVQQKAYKRSKQYRYIVVFSKWFRDHKIPNNDSHRNNHGMQTLITIAAGSWNELTIFINVCDILHYTTKDCYFMNVWTLYYEGLLSLAVWPWLWTYHDLPRPIVNSMIYYDWLKFPWFTMIDCEYHDHLWIPWSTINDCEYHDLPCLIKNSMVYHDRLWIPWFTMILQKMAIHNHPSW